MSIQTILDWCAGQAARNPRPFYVTGPARFGPNGFDCSGFTFMAYKVDGKAIPADTAGLARWGRTNGQLRTNPAEWWPGDLLLRSRRGDIYNSGGPDGHTGVFVRRNPNGTIVCYESAGSGSGVNLYTRPVGFWSHTARHPAYADARSITQEGEDVTEEEIQRIIGTIQTSIRTEVAAALDRELADNNRIIGTLQSNLREVFVPQIVNEVVAAIKQP